MFTTEINFQEVIRIATIFPVVIISSCALVGFVIKKFLQFIVKG